MSQVGFAGLVFALVTGACQAQGSSAPSVDGSSATVPGIGSTFTSSAPTVTTTVGADDEWPTCGISPVLEGILTGPGSDLISLLEGSPLAPHIEAARQGARLPAVSQVGAEWVVEDYNLQALLIAVWLNCPDMVRQILDWGVPADGLIRQASRTPAMEAAVQQEWDVVEMLLVAGADPLRSDPSDPFSSVLEHAGGVDLATLEMVLGYTDLADERAAGVLDGAIGVAAMTEDPAEVEESLAIMGRLSQAGGRPTVDALLASTSELVPVQIFDGLLDLAEDAEYRDVVTAGALAEGMFDVCYTLDPVNKAMWNDPQRLERLVTFLSSLFLEQGLPCPTT